MEDERFFGGCMSGPAMILWCLSGLARHNGYVFNTVEGIRSALGWSEDRALLHLRDCIDSGVAFVCDDGHVSWAPYEAKP